MSLRAFLYLCNTPSQPPKQNHSELEEIPVSQSIRCAKASTACSLLRHLACAKNSHFLAISTETGYLFLRTSPALNIKPQVPPHVSCPGHNPRHQAIPLAPWALNEGKEVPTNKHLTSLSLCLSSSVPVLLTGCKQASLHLNYCIFFRFSPSICFSMECPEWVGFGCLFGQLNHMQRARKAVSIPENYFIQ